MNTETKQDVAAQVQQVMANEPGLKELAETLRARFGARLIALKADGVDIGWSKWSEQRKHAITWEGSAKWFQQGKAEWKHIKAETIAAGELARRKPSLRKSGVLR